VASDRRCAGNVAGVCIVRNAVDLAPLLCGHYLGFGFAHLAFIDDGSSDGTFEYLSKIANRTGRVSVRQVHYETFEQQTLMTESANALVPPVIRSLSPSMPMNFGMSRQLNSNGFLTPCQGNSSLPNGSISSKREDAKSLRGSDF
jgi:hypothetical protein